MRHGIGPSSALAPMASGGARPRGLTTQLRHALANLHDTAALRAHPLAQVMGLADGRALRQALIDTIEALRPAGERRAASKAWRRYEGLRLRYVEGLTVSEVLAALAIGRSEFYREQSQAIETLAEHLALSPMEPPVLRVLSSSPEPRPPAPSTAPPSSRALTSFVGREAELREIERLLTGEARLLTLIGPPGTGKTRLAAEAARRLAGLFAAVWLVPLAAVTDPTLAMGTVARVLGLPASTVEPGARVAHQIGAASVLLVLDNAEHLVAVGTDVAALLDACPALRVLVTSRAPLRLYGEQELAVGPLALDGGTDGESEAARLFVDRARAVAPRFRPRGTDRAAVAEICRRLDGLPLAIELAAARTRVLPPAALLERLGSRLALLTDGPRDLSPRQRTLRGAIDWSHELLDEAERRTFRRLGVFVGGFTLDAAAEVAGVPLGDALDGVAALLERSLVGRVDADGPPRFAMLETIREYALERLSTSCDEIAVRERHYRYYAAMANAGTDDQDAFDVASARAIERLTGELPNVRAALAWALRGRPAAAVGLAGRLIGYWNASGQHAEGRAWLADALRLPGAAPGTAERRWLLGGAGQLAWIQGDAAAARALHRESLAEARRAGDDLGVCLALGSLAEVARAEGDVEAAGTGFEECLALARRIGYRAAMARPLTQLGVLAGERGDAVGARRYLDEACALRRGMGALGPLGMSLGALAEVERRAGAFGPARARADEAIEHVRAHGKRWYLPEVLLVAGAISLDRGELARGEAEFDEALAVAREIGSRGRVARALEELARAAGVRGDEAARRARLRESLAVWRGMGRGDAVARVEAALTGQALWPSER